MTGRTVTLLRSRCRPLRFSRAAAAAAVTVTGGGGPANGSAWKVPCQCSWRSGAGSSPSRAGAGPSPARLGLGQAGAASMQSYNGKLPRRPPAPSPLQHFFKLCLHVTSVPVTNGAALYQPESR